MTELPQRTTDAVARGARPARRPGPKPRLSPELIVDAAFRISERDGALSLTFQALGDELGAHPTAIYRHFRDRDELLLELLDALHAETLGALPPATGVWDEDLRALLVTTYDVFQHHPQIAQHAGVRTARRPHEFRIVDLAIGCLLRAGFDLDQAARYYRVVCDFVLAYAAQDAALKAMDPAIREADLRSWEVEYRQLPESEYPNIMAVTGAIPSLEDSGNFVTALDLMLDAVRARVPAAPSFVE